ncbi:MAG: DUF971 domain-containing protein [Anaerolineae bacterium]|nr:DUF971 domain-containing protein [Anaerolineae bacterium]
MSAITPTNITLEQSAGLLIIDWSDGKTCRYPVGPLRMACPCVECRGGHENMGRHTDPDTLLDLVPTQAYQVERLELVGNYALQFFWDDGHHTGIYTWDFLYRLCPEQDSDAS